MSEVGTVIRNFIADYLNVAKRGALKPDWALMGPGFTNLDENPNAQAETRAYISDRSTSSIIRGYEAQFPYSTDIMVDQRAVMAIYSVGRNQKQATGAEKDYVRTEVFLPTGIEDVHPARMFRVAIEVSDTSGEGTQIVESSGNLNQVGNFIPGVFNITTLEFTEGTYFANEPDVLVVSVEGQTIRLLDGLFLEANVTP